MLYQTKSQLEYSIHGRPDKRDKPSGLCKECYSSSWKRFGGFKHNTEIKAKMSKRFTGDSNPMFGKQHSDETRMKIKEKRKLQRISDETRKKMSRSHRLRVERGEEFVCPNYNRKSIPFIESYGKTHGYNFQHAENGGEYLVKGLGYWVDAYDKEKNVILEIDEPHHFSNGKLKEKDMNRQEEIRKKLNCKFIRVKIQDGDFHVYMEES